MYLQEYEEAVKISTAHDAPFVLAFVRQGLLLHKLRKGNVSPSGLLRVSTATKVKATFICCHAV